MQESTNPLPLAIDSGNSLAVFSHPESRLIQDEIGRRERDTACAGAP